MKSNRRLRELAFSALFAAAIAVTTAYILHFPLPTGGYIHIGDALLYLGACLLPLPWAMAAGAVGGALADLLTAPMWALPTFFIKAALCLPFTRKGAKVLCPRNLAAVLLSGLLSPALSGLVNVALTGLWTAFLPQFLGTLIQAAASGAVFLVLAGGLDRVGLKRRLGL